MLNANHPGYPHPNPITIEYYLSEMTGYSSYFIVVKEEDFRLALANVIPSVSHTEILHYTRVREQFEGRLH